MNATTKAERYVAKADAKGWLVGDRYSMRVVSRHNSPIAAQYAAKHLNREWTRARSL